MSYTPTEWSPGDTITAVKLNKLEQGIANGGGISYVTENYENGIYTLGNTWQEIHDMLDNNVLVIIQRKDANGIYLNVCSGCGIVDNSYCIYCSFDDNYSTKSASGYPGRGDGQVV